MVYKKKMAFQINPSLRRRLEKLKYKQVLICLLVGVLILFVFVYSRNNGDTAENGESHGWIVGRPYTSKLPSLTYEGRDFVVKGKKMRLLSGTIHYFRVVPDYWNDRLLKLKAMGLNTVETYVAWNMHEPLPGKYDFTGILDLKQFVITAQKLDLNVIVRPGPYICGEWDNGGLPAWLLHDPNMRLRSTYKPYQDAVEKYFTELFKILVPLQGAYGGPVIAFQVENEYAQHNVDNTTAKEHMNFLSNLMRRLGAVEMFVTSDGGNDLVKSKQIAPENALLTVNFQKDPQEELRKLMNVQPDKPMMVMEFWPGWFDHWGYEHLKRDVTATELIERITTILKLGSSFNLYMFHGGTNFGFMNGANIVDGQYLPDVTSYDYGAPLSECGDITTKYAGLRNVLQDFASDSIPVPLPDSPINSKKASYGEVQLSLYLKLIQALDYAPPPYESTHPLSMELLPLNNGAGQGYGYVLYRTTIPSTSSKVTITDLRDHGVALLDYQPVSKLTSFASQSFILNPKMMEDESGRSVLDILVENTGRVNFGKFVGERKGINGDVLIDGKHSERWKIYSFEFKSDFIEQVTSGGLWTRTPSQSNVGPSLYKGDFTISGHPEDTFIDMLGWTKGIVFINGVNIGRYWNIGPQQTLYVPAPLLKRGINRVLIFEMHRPKTSFTVYFRESPVLNKKPETEM